MEMNLHLGLEVVLEDSSQPFEMIDNNGGTGWFAPQKYLKNLPGVVKCELLDTTSSAGDWSGYFAVKTSSNIALIAFSQNNNYPQGSGYVLQTDSQPFEYVNTEDEIEEAVNDWASSQYN